LVLIGVAYLAPQTIKFAFSKSLINLVVLAIKEIQSYVDLASLLSTCHVLSLISFFILKKGFSEVSVLMDSL
jgi:hypothetical protein